MIIFLPFIVTDFKNKMESRKFTTSRPSGPVGLRQEGRAELPEQKINIDEEFLFWFSGFTDGEGNFSIFLDKVYIRFRFKINLHIDDIEVLKTIQSKLNIGIIVIEENKNSCAFIVQSFS